VHRVQVHAAEMRFESAPSCYLVFVGRVAIAIFVANTWRASCASVERSMSKNGSTCRHRHCRGHMTHRTMRRLRSSRRRIPWPAGPIEARAELVGEVDIGM
jgi:hypothetical protein